eukprot:3077326-Rhodomonas_salina.2
MPCLPIDHPSSDDVRCVVMRWAASLREEVGLLNSESKRKEHALLESAKVRHDPILNDDSRSATVSSIQKA